MATNNVLNSPEPFALAIGGTNANLTASNGGIIYSTASAMAVLAGTATASQVLLSGASTTPAWSTATYPATTTVNQILYSSSANVIAGLATTDSAVLTTTSAGIPGWVALTNGQLAIGSTGATPTAATLSAGTGISITNGAGSITINSIGSGLTWTTVAGSSQAAAVNNGYIINDASSLVTVTLPATAAIGATVAVVGFSADGWTLAANTGQTIQLGNVATTSGGSWSSVNQFDNIVVVCVVANTTWAVISAVSAGLTKA